MSKTDKLSIIIDDKRGDAMTLEGDSTWAVDQADQWLNGTLQTADFGTRNGARRFGQLRLKFHGTSASFIGVTPTTSNPQIFTVSIDGKNGYQTTYGDPNPPSYRQWYQTPLLPEGDHTVVIDNLSGPSIDFATVDVGKQTPLRSETVIVDNVDSGIKYNGRWRWSQDAFNSGPKADGLPFGNSTQQTPYVGDSFTYRFTGVSISIYGIFSWSNIGQLSLAFTLDGETLKKDFRVDANTPQHVQEIGQQAHFKFHSFDFMSPGDHNLTVSVTNNVNQLFAFDYLTYTPTFDKLADMPDLSQVSDQPNNGGGNQSEGRSTPMGAIIGGVVAGVALLLAIGAFLFIRRRRRASSRIGGSSKYSPLAPFITHPRGQVTVIPLSNQQNSAPTSASSFYDRTPMSDRQDQSAAVYGLAFPPNAQPNTYSEYQPNQPPAMHDPFATERADERIAQYGAPGPTPTLQSTQTHTSGTGRATAADSNSHDSWETHDPGEPAPPSYDFVTGGRAPTHITYVVQTPR